jgi:SAM-dependent methyltransferase
VSMPTTGSRVPDDWFAEFHQGLAARFWRAAGAAMTERDLAHVRAVLAAPPGAALLDVPCGDGRLALRLAQDGYAVTGVDIAPAEVALARRRAADAGVTADFAAGDLRALPVDGPFDAVLSWGNSFGYLTPDGTAASLAELRRVLRPGGQLALESLTVAESYLTGALAPQAEHEFGGIRMTASYRYDPTESRMESELVFEAADGAVEHARAAHRVHTSGEVVRMLRAAGFAEVTLLGADGTQPYAIGSPRLIAVAIA